VLGVWGLLSFAHNPILPDCCLLRWLMSPFKWCLNDSSNVDSSISSAWPFGVEYGFACGHSVVRCVACCTFFRRGCCAFDIL